MMTAAELNAMVQKIIADNAMSMHEEFILTMRTTDISQMTPTLMRQYHINGHPKELRLTIGVDFVPAKPYDDLED